MEENKMLKAQKVYESLCKAMENRGWGCNKDAEELRMDFTVQGEDLSMGFRIFVDQDRMLVILYSIMPFSLSMDKLTEGALTICYINDGLADGSFDLDIETGRLCFRMTMSYIGSLLGDEAFDYLLGYSTAVTDEYNDKLLMISKGMLSLEQFKQSV